MVQRILCRYGRENERIIQDYIRNQLEEDNMHEQISMKEYIDPFTGSKNK